MILPLGAKFNELLREFFVLELDKDRALEKLFGGAPQLDVVDRTILGEESLNVELGGGNLVTESLNVDTRGLSGLLSIAAGLVGVLSFDGFLALLATDNEAGAFTEGSDDGSVGLESAHSLEGAEGLDGDWLVLFSSSGFPHKLITRQVGVAEVILDLIRSRWLAIYR